jgi:RNA recognition motif-containing protein
VPKDDRAKSKGFGLVQFETRRDAEEAIRIMDQAKFNDRVVTVKWDQKY